MRFGRKIAVRSSEVPVRFVITPFAALLVLSTFVLSPALLALAQTTGRTNPDLVITSMAGRDLFEFYCASCHGRDGKGKGYAASALKKAPPDLTTLAQRNHGTFPTDRVTALITGEERLSTPAHGSSDMPVWGPIFKGLDDRKAVNEARIENIVKHIESMQAKAKAAPDVPAR
jgi:mono/diheme cytochrome c family protein